MLCYKIALTKVVVVKYFPSPDMVADVLTKFFLPIPLHFKHVGRMVSDTYQDHHLFGFKYGGVLDG